MDVTPSPCLQNEDIGTGAAKAALTLAILPGKMTAAISAKVLVQASIGIPQEYKAGLVSHNRVSSDITPLGRDLCAR